MEPKKTIINVPKGCKATVEQFESAVIVTVEPATSEETRAVNVIVQLAMLRDQYNVVKLEQGSKVYSIKQSTFCDSGLTIVDSQEISFLSFKDYETAELFLETFEPLIQEILCVQL